MNIREKIYNYFDKQPRLHVLFVFDPMGLLENDIMQIDESWPEDYTYVKFAGDWFTTKVRLASEWANKKVVILFDHNYPQPNEHNQESCRNFPLMSVLASNMVFHEEDAVAFMQQRGIPAQFQPFVEEHLSELLRDRYDKILSPYYNASSFSLDVAYRGIISGYLGQSRMLEWYQIIGRLIILSTESPDKVNDFFHKANMLSGSIKASDIERAFNDKLKSLVGFEINLNEQVKMQPVVEAIKYNLLTEKLSIDRCDPYIKLKVDDSLKLQNIYNIMEQIRNDAQLSTKFEKAFETLGAHIREETIVDIYGINAAYSHLSEKMCKLIAKNISTDMLYSAPGLAAEKLGKLASNLLETCSTRTVIEFLRDVALWNDKRQSFKTFVLNIPNAYVEKYISSFYELDSLYRTALVVYVALPANYSSELVDGVRRRLDTDYAEVVNTLNSEWVKCVAENDMAFCGISSIESQAQFFKKHVSGIKNKVVVIVSDALRYEMAIDLSNRLTNKKHVAKVQAMLAGLPTETKYCKPVLFPHNTLQYADTNLLVDGKTLTTSAERSAQFSAYIEDGLCVDYKSLMAKSKAEKRDIFKHQCVYVMHNTIDEHCHGCSLAEFAYATEQALEELRTLVLFLHDAANVAHVFITSDHGFLYNAHRFEEKDKLQTAEPAQGEKKSRYILDTMPCQIAGLTTFSLCYASPIEGEVFVKIPTGSNRIMVNGGDYEFAHGGASLQEMIVPVFYSHYNRENEKGCVGVSLMETHLSVTSSHLKVHLVQEQAVTMNIQERTVVVALYAGGEKVSAEKTVTLNSTDVKMGASRIYEISLIVTLTNSSTKIMQLKVYDVNDNLNPLIEQNVVNNTLIEQDDF